MTPAGWKIAVACAAALWLALAGYWLRGTVEEARQAGVLREQIRATAAEQDRVNGIARAAETELAAARARNSDLNKKWNSIRANKTRAVCALDDDTVRLLRAARAPGDAPR